MPTWLFVLAQLSIVAFAVLGGVFLTFSDFVMRGLAATRGGSGPEAMQATNREVFRSVCMPLFLGMVPLSLLVGIGAWLTLADSMPFVVAAACYVVGAFGITTVCNVPLDKAPAAHQANAPDGRAYWRSTYVPRWNGVRTAACLNASGLLLHAVARAPWS